MPVIQTQELKPNVVLPQNQQIYCGLDSAITLEVFDELKRTFPQPPAIYNFERALQGPYLEIMLRGFKVDELERRNAAAKLRSRCDVLQNMLNEFTTALIDEPVKARSPKLKDVFYKGLRIPEIYISIKGERKLSLNREVLEKIEERYLYARPLVSCILAIRDLAKQAEVFETEVDADGRFRTSYNIAGTETGRPSSSENAYGTGGNAQNIRPSLRYVFEADHGYKLCVIDLEQVEARDVGFFAGVLFNDWSFLDACESGDLHTSNARLVWPELNWSGELKTDKEIASRLFYRDFSYRDMSKRGGHLSNYMGTAWTASRSLKVPLPVMEEFQARYCRGRPANPAKGLPAIEPAYPCISLYWQWVAQQLQTEGLFITPFGRQRHFFGRRDDDTTLREAIAFLPQSTTADRMNLGLWRIWRYMPEVELLAQTYDSVTFQYRETADEDAIIQKALKLVEVELKAQNGRSYVVPGEAKTGWNWGAEITQKDVQKALSAGRVAPRLNPEGLRKWKKGVRDDRERSTGLRRIMR